MRVLGSKRGRDSKVMVRRYDAILRWPAPLITPSRTPGMEERDKKPSQEDEHN